jgi:hypothetical protein
VGITSQLAASGWGIAFTYGHVNDDGYPGLEAEATAAITQSLAGHGATAVATKPTWLWSPSRPGYRRVRGGQCVAGGGHQPPGQVAAHRQARPAANRVTPSAASRAGSANSAATSRPVFVPSTLPSTSVSPGETPVMLAQRLVLDRRAGAGPAGLVRGPGGQLHDHRVLPAGRDALPCKQRAGHRLQVNGIGLDPTPAPDGAARSRAPG